MPFSTGLCPVRPPCKYWVMINSSLVISSENDSPNRAVMSGGGGGEVKGHTKVQEESCRSDQYEAQCHMACV